MRVPAKPDRTRARRLQDLAVALGRVPLDSPPALEQRDSMLADIRRIIEHTAVANAANAEFAIDDGSNTVTVNDPELTRSVLPTLQRVVGADNVKEVNPVTASEDFSWFAQHVPSVFFFVGITPRDQDPTTAPSNHSDYFYIDEEGLAVGLRAMVQVAVDYLQSRA